MGSPEILELPVDDIVLEADLNLRDRIDNEAVERYAEAWDRVPPVTVFEVEGRWLLADGFHRHAAALNRNKRAIRAEVRPGTFADALDFAAGANLAHGLPLTRAERRRAVEVKLRLHPDWSDRRHAEGLGVGRETVGRVRRQLVDAGQIPPDVARVGADGKTYTAGLPRDPNERLPQGPAIAQRDDPRDRGGREADRAPWDDATDPLPVADRPEGEVGPPPRGLSDRRAALADPVGSAAPTVDEMLGLMAGQVMEVVEWSRAEGFADAYRGASPAARVRFQDAVDALATRSDALRGG